MVKIKVSTALFWFQMSLCAFKEGYVINHTCFEHGSFNNITCSCLCEDLYVPQFSCQMTVRELIIGDNSLSVRILIDAPFYFAILCFSSFFIGFMYVIFTTVLYSAGKRKRGSWSIYLFSFTCMVGLAQLFCNYNSYNDTYPFYMGQFLWIMMYVATLTCHSAVVYSFFDMMAIFENPLTVKRKAFFKSAETVVFLAIVLISSHFLNLLLQNSMLQHLFNLSLFAYMFALSRWVSSCSRLCILAQDSMDKILERNISADLRKQQILIYQVRVYIKYFNRCCAFPCMIILVYLVVTNMMFGVSTATSSSLRKHRIINLVGSVVAPLILEVISMGLILWLTFNSRTAIPFIARSPSKLSPTCSSRRNSVIININGTSQCLKTKHSKICEQVA